MASKICVQMRVLRKLELRECTLRMSCKTKFRELKTAKKEKALLEKSKINTIWHKVVLL